MCVRQINNENEKTRKDIIDLIHLKYENYDKVIIKIEDKKQEQLMKEVLNHTSKVALINIDKKDVKIKRQSTL